MRQHVIEKLSRNDPLILILSTRFSGATTLLRSWLAEAATSGTVVAQVIDPEPDITEDDYWSRVDATLRQRIGLPPTGSAGATAFASLLDSLACQVDPVVLVLDDVHLIPDPAPRIEDLLASTAPSGVRVIATSRIEFSKTRLFTRGSGRQIIEPGELHFRTDDVTALLRESGIDYDVRAAGIIHRVTGGLPALVHATCSTVPLEQVSEPRRLAENLPGIIDRELDRVISGDPALAGHRRELLLSAAADPLTRDSVDLCVNDDPSAFLDALERSGLARPSGSPTKDEWRYKEPVRASLLRLAESEIPNELVDFRARVVRYWLTHDRPNRALKVAGDAEDWSSVIEIIREHHQVLYTRHYPTTMDDEILLKVPAHLVAGDPLLRRGRSLHQRFASARDSGSPVPALPGPAKDESAPQLFDTVVRCVELRVNGQFGEAADLCETITITDPPDLDALSTDERDTMGLGLVHIGLCFLLAGRQRAAITYMRRSLGVAVSPFIRRDAAGKLALIYTVFGDLETAQSWLAEERRHPALPANTELLVRPAGDVAAALLALDRLDIDSALEMLHDLGSPADREEFWGFILYASGQSALINGTPTAGLRYVEREIPRFDSMRGNGAVVGPLLDAVRADLHLASGRIDAAASLVADSSHPLTLSARARVLLLSDRAEAALTLARQGRSDINIPDRHAMELDLVAATAALATGDRALAQEFLKYAVDASRLTGMRSPFRSLPAQVIRRLAEIDIEIPFEAVANRHEYGDLTFAGDADGVAASPPSGEEAEKTGRVEPLTSRELAVLRDLATDATNREIAQSSFVSVNTVKSQIRAIYRKLSVTTRADAVAAAQRLGII